MACPVSFITGSEMSSELSARRLSWMLPMVGLLVALVWLGSLDRYVSARYHLSLEAALPEPMTKRLFAVSRWLDAHGRDQEPAFRLAWPGAASERPLESRDAQPAVPEPPKWEALPDALTTGAFLPSLAPQKLAPGPQRILFAGDSMMQGVAPLVMRQWSQQHPDWQMRDLSRQSTGLTVKRYFDWPAKIIEEMDAQGLTLVVIFMGPNDPWDMLVDGQRHVFPSSGWAYHYALRVDEILAAAAQRQVRVVWLGLPSMREGRVKDGASLINQVVHARVKAWGADYLATEPLIGVLSEPFKKFKPDEQGQILNLRAEDGVHLTPTGLRLIQQALQSHIDQAVVQP
ncbi:MAG: hypothetical protein CFE39_14185 [Comamonadaceae bacterium PBBC2]|nr:MAG: hypothetical protein CFE39_14185 [Comamonadaceae bacterium PBBC2]